jgi:hypothetical protein
MKTNKKSTTKFPVPVTRQKKQKLPVLTDQELLDNVEQNIKEGKDLLEIMQEELGDSAERVTITPQEDLF